MIGRWLLCAALAAGLIHVAEPAFAQEGGAVVTAEAREVEEDDRSLVRVDVTARDVTDLGAFEFIMTFTGDVLEVDRIEQGDFLGSSGREVFCGDPTIDTNALRYFCTTLGAEPRDGAEGEGLIAVVYFETKGEGQSNLQFSRAQLTTPPGDPIDTEWQSGVIEIKDDGGTNWALFAIIGGAVVAGIVVLAAVLAVVSRRRSSSGSLSYPAEGE